MLVKHPVRFPGAALLQLLPRLHDRISAARGSFERRCLCDRRARPIASTYSFRGDRSGRRAADAARRDRRRQHRRQERPQRPTSPRTSSIHVLGITEIEGGGDIDVLTNGYVTLTEKTGDLRVERIRSTFDDVLLYSPARIVDARTTPAPASRPT